MPDFTELLAQTVRGATVAYETALSDLTEVVKGANAAAKKLDEELSVALFPVEKDTAGSTFMLAVRRAKKSQKVGYYKVSAEGYPIRYGGSELDLTLGRSTGLNSHEAVEKHFREMMSSKSSPLVVAILYLLRE